MNDIDKILDTVEAVLPETMSIFCDGYRKTTKGGIIEFYSIQDIDGKDISSFDIYPDNSIKALFLPTPSGNVFTYENVSKYSEALEKFVNSKLHNI